MKILILGLNYAPEEIGIAVYTTGMAEKLSETGHEVRVVTGNPYYPAWRVMKGYKAWRGSSRVETNGVDVRRVPHYIPANPTGLKRLLHHASFAFTSLFPSLWRALAWRPDIVFTVAPSLIAAPNAWIVAKLSGARRWLHIQDFEVEAAFATGLLKDGNRAAKLARGFESWIINRFDIVSSISPQMCKRLEIKGVPKHKIYEFRNWADIEAIKPMAGLSQYREEWNIKTKSVALYSGNIANKQGIEIIVDAARLLHNRHDLTFVICGEGPNRAKLKKRAEGLTNIQFHDLQPKERLNELMGLATVHLLPQMAGAADLVLPSKLTNMLASGRPVVATAEAGTGLAKEVEGCGIAIATLDPDLFAETIVDVLENKKKYNIFSQCARERAVRRWSKSAILEEIEEELIKTLLFRDVGKDQ